MGELTDWERELLDSSGDTGTVEYTDDTVPVEDVEDSTDDTGRVRAWPELYEPHQGGTAGLTVDLAPIWERMYRDHHPDGQDPFDHLAEIAGGLAKRLAGGAWSLTSRRDAHTDVRAADRLPHSRPHPLTRA